MFGKEDEEGDEEDDQSGTRDGRKSYYGSEGNNEFAKKWGWTFWVDRVSETTREPWSVVYDMNPYTFFNLLSYRKDKEVEEKRQMDEWKRTH